MKQFLEKNLNKFHIAGMMLFSVLSIFYWWKSGQYSEYFFKSNLLLVILWGLIVGWITGDFVFNARHRD